ncbi:hypothetical protein FISHEDRAFT_33045 [Fistulina hepatica ATCC 64428]|uniref:Alpha-ketoglutarate-dependent dioxygenase AlkB-like domain-containing protein n=1 Tax=Fistulina hepatica ATCC 64428 TaxID=1128425 RepID=A0A0D7ARV3_9AGAR|nr:hypothetical protein FISHEDRAFT_33045 [Fistulina hepatica ATCC 64428]
MHEYLIHVLPSGTIFQIKCSPFARLRADEIFREYQEQAYNGSLIFRRWPLGMHMLRGSMLTNYFSQNTGVPYRYVGGTEGTVPFDRAASAVSKARNMIISQIKLATGSDISFNEVLSAAYMENQGMSYHSDAETGLGPDVAGLSLGAPAVMRFRPTKRYVAEFGGTRTCHASFYLGHGDILWMRGSKVQEYYQHEVKPSNFRIAATARFISPENYSSSKARPSTSNPCNI